MNNRRAGLVVLLAGVLLGWLLWPVLANASTPLPKISANSNGWHGQVRPDHVFLGKGSAPEVVNLHWRSYGQWTAEATGTVYWPSSFASPRAVRVNVWRPRHHTGTPGRFFTRMNWTFSGRTKHFRFATEGGTFPVWVQFFPS
jgi:hypothetical protein